jgi:hypothetical protein
MFAKKTCPVCQQPLARLSSYGVCKHCDSFLQTKDGEFAPVPEETIAPEPAFGAPTHWPDVVNVTFPGIMAPSLTIPAGARVLEAQWPSECCVCNRPADHGEQIAVTVKIPWNFGILNLGEKKVVLVAKDAPHCRQHKGGAAFSRIEMASEGRSMPFGIRFRSLAFRNKFRRLNPWPWPRF